MSYEQPKNETEILSADEQKVREICLSLKRVDAPKDFDLRLKARIANRRPGDFKPRFGWAFRYAVPALAVVLVFSVLVYNGIFSSLNENKAAFENPAEPETKAILPENNYASVENSPLPKDSDSADLIALQPETPIITQDAVAAESTQISPKDKKQPSKKDDFNGSKVFSSTEGKSEQPIINSNTFPRIPDNFVKPNPVAIKNLLSDIGINAVLENGKWLVRSVTPNGLTERSGVKEADIIEAIDNQSLSSETVLVKTFSGKIITVLRGGKKLEIKLQN